VANHSQTQHHPLYPFEKVYIEMVAPHMEAHELVALVSLREHYKGVLTRIWNASPSSIKRDSMTMQRQAEEKRVELAQAEAMNFIAERRNNH